MIRLSEEALPLKSGCVLTIGNFDGVHIGHRALIEKTVAVARALSVPSVVWTFGEHPQSFFGANSLRYLTGAYEKAAFIEKAGADMYFTAEFAKYKDMSADRFVDEVLVGAFGVKHVVCGYDFSFGKGGSGNPEQLLKLLSRYGVPLTVLPPVCVEGVAVSSTGLRALITAGDMETARKHLGRPYGFYLPVTHGNRIGRTIGSPTVNQRFPAERVVPAYGVYAAFCIVGGKTYAAVSNVGVKPTVNTEDKTPVCETHIFDFNGDLYGQSVWVYLYKRIRAEKRFESVEELSAQIAADKEAARLITEGVTDV